MKFVSEEKSWLEWTVFALSTLLTIALVGYLVHDAVQNRGTPADVRISLGDPTLTEFGYSVPVKVTNQGETTAREVEVEVATHSNPPQTATLSFDFLSAEEVREGWVGFNGKPSGPLSSRVMSHVGR